MADDDGLRRALVNHPDGNSQDDDSNQDTQQRP
jgi:hypothetical protein